MVPNSMTFLQPVISPATFGCASTYTNQARRATISCATSVTRLVLAWTRGSHAVPLPPTASASPRGVGGGRSRPGRIATLALAGDLRDRLRPAAHRARTPSAELRGDPVPDRRSQLVGGAHRAQGRAAAGR